MTKSYTLSYFINTYQLDQAESRIDQEGLRGDDMMFKDISEIQFSPSDRAVQQILNFSKCYEVLHSSQTESIEVMKN